MANRTFPSYFMYKDNQGLWRWRGEDSTFPRILPQQTNPPLSLGLGYGMEIHRVTRRINGAQNDSFRTVTNRLNVSIVI